jgi:hypothetical protein
MGVTTLSTVMGCQFYDSKVNFWAAGQWIMWNHCQFNNGVSILWQHCWFMFDSTVGWSVTGLSVVWQACQQCYNTVNSLTTLFIHVWQHCWLICDRAVSCVTGLSTVWHHCQFCDSTVNWCVTALLNNDRALNCVTGLSTGLNHCQFCDSTVDWCVTALLNNDRAVHCGGPNGITGAKQKLWKEWLILNTWDENRTSQHSFWTFCLHEFHLYFALSSTTLLCFKPSS